MLKEYCKKESNNYFLQHFSETLENTNNILMVYYNLKFINELLVATVDESERETLREEMINVKYSIIIENIKGRLEEGFYKIDVCSFASVYTQINKYATKGKK